MVALNPTTTRVLAVERYHECDADLEDGSERYRFRISSGGRGRSAGDAQWVEPWDVDDTQTEWLLLLARDNKLFDTHGGCNMTSARSQAYREAWQEHEAATAPKYVNSQEMRVSQPKGGRAVATRSLPPDCRRVAPRKYRIGRKPEPVTNSSDEEEDMPLKLRKACRKTTQATTQYDDVLGDLSEDDLIAALEASSHVPPVKPEPMATEPVAEPVLSWPGPPQPPSMCEYTDTMQVTYQRTYYEERKPEPTAASGLFGGMMKMPSVRVDATNVWNPSGLAYDPSALSGGDGGVSPAPIPAPLTAPVPVRPRSPPRDPRLQPPAVVVHPARIEGAVPAGRAGLPGRAFFHYASTRECRFGVECKHRDCAFQHPPQWNPSNLRTREEEIQLTRLRQENARLQAQLRPRPRSRSRSPRRRKADRDHHRVDHRERSRPRTRSRSRSRSRSPRRRSRSRSRSRSRRDLHFKSKSKGRLLNPPPKTPPKTPPKPPPVQTAPPRPMHQGIAHALAAYLKVDKTSDASSEHTADEFLSPDTARKVSEIEQALFPAANVQPVPVPVPMATGPNGRMCATNPLSHGA